MESTTYDTYVRMLTFRDKRYVSETFAPLQLALFLFDD